MGYIFIFIFFVIYLYAFYVWFTWVKEGAIFNNHSVNQNINKAGEKRIDSRDKNTESDKEFEFNFDIDSTDNFNFEQQIEEKSKKVKNPWELGKRRKKSRNTAPSLNNLGAEGSKNNNSDATSKTEEDLFNSIENQFKSVENKVETSRASNDLSDLFDDSEFSKLMDVTSSNPSVEADEKVVNKPIDRITEVKPESTSDINQIENEVSSEEFDFLAYLQENNGEENKGEDTFNETQKTIEKDSESIDADNDFSFLENFTLNDDPKPDNKKENNKKELNDDLSFLENYNFEQPEKDRVEENFFEKKEYKKESYKEEQKTDFFDIPDFSFEQPDDTENVNTNENFIFEKNAFGSGNKEAKMGKGKNKETNNTDSNFNFGNESEINEDLDLDLDFGVLDSLNRKEDKQTSSNEEGTFGQKELEETNNVVTDDNFDPMDFFADLELPMLNEEKDEILVDEKEDFSFNEEDILEKLENLTSMVQESDK